VAVQALVGGLPCGKEDEDLAGIVLCVAIAVLFDAMILTAVRVTTPWRRA
jgi:hypothetical protein